MALGLLRGAAVSEPLREAFEAWAKREGIDIAVEPRLNLLVYRKEPARCAWLAWQAAAQRAPSALDEELYQRTRRQLNVAIALIRRFLEREAPYAEARTFLHRLKAGGKCDLR